MYRTPEAVRQHPAGMKTLLTAPISKASAKQRTGCAGRIQDGICYRLYTNNFFEKSLLANTPPGMLISEVMAEVLVLKSYGFHKIFDFNFVDGPHAETLLRALYELRALWVLDVVASFIFYTDR